MPVAQPINPLLDQLDINQRATPFKRAGYKSAPRRNKNLKQLLSDPSRAGTGASTPVAPGDPLRAAPTSAPAGGDGDAVMSDAAGLHGALGGGGGGGGVGPTYANIESAPSFVRGKKWCDVTGLPAKYTDPKTKLRYADQEVFQALKQLPPGGAEAYLEVRAANVVLK